MSQLTRQGGEDRSPYQRKTPPIHQYRTSPFTPPIPTDQEPVAVEGDDESLRPSKVGTVNTQQQRPKMTRVSTDVSTVPETEPDTEITREIIQIIVSSRKDQ